MAALLPVLFGFFIMGFVDFVGIATNYAKDIFPDISPVVIGFLPSAVFLWFFVFSVPTALLMTKIGRKKTVLLSTSLTTVAMILPLLAPKSFWVWVVAFSLIGIGNTIIQVSLNPLLKNVVSGKLLTSAMTFGQFVKAISSFVGPYIAAYAAVKLVVGPKASPWLEVAGLGDFKWAFVIFAGLSLLGTIWLAVTPTPVGEDERSEGKVASFGGNLALLGDPKILVFFLGILFVVGVDVGMNVTSPAILKAKLGMSTDEAGWGTQLYFIGRTVGAFLGAFILAKFAKGLVFKVCMLASLGALVLLLGSEKWMLYTGIMAVGFFCANIFSIIFAFAIGHKPERTDEISGLMIMGVSGGAIFPPLMNLAALKTEVVPGIAEPVTTFAPAGAIVVLAICMGYLLLASFVAKEKAA